MSWLFSQALVEEYSVATSSAGQPSAQLNVMPTLHKFWCNGKTMDASALSRFGLTLQLLTEDRGMEILTWYLRGFPAKELVLRERAPDSMMSAADYGAMALGSFAKLSREEFSWKTAQCSLLADSGEFLQTWPRWGSMRNGECWERLASAPPISGTGFGYLLPTPSGCRSGKNHVVGRLDEWGGSSNPWRGGNPIGKTSSPVFEEWVMGWPEQWTALMPLEMAKFQEWQQQHSQF